METLPPTTSGRVYAAPPPPDWHTLILPALGILAALAMALAHLLPPEAVFTFVVGVVLPAPGQAYRPLPPQDRE